ncbi:hypothetical protein Glove_318g54 [Diversispora epigaea]|uniref:Protein kinase domain-containing protein n=1 Tax=Diversispora epigaea TaxID=1348612 RepID=A0A397HQ41_9GLOM|nr:hypothetical protein Glove_318g54 [Diversispora epigaea]
MSFSNNKKDLTRIAEDRKIQKFDYNTFEDIELIANGGFGVVNRAYSKVLKKHVALKCLHDENNNKFYKAFMNELQNIIAVNHHKNIIKYYGVSIDHLAEKCYLVLQYAKDDNLRTYLRNNFKDLDWNTKINMAQDITNGLCYIHKANIVHRDLHSKNILVHEGRLLITDLGISKSLDTNSNSFAGGMYAYSDPEYLRNSIKYKRDKASDIYSLGVIFWELSSGRPPFDNKLILEILEIVKSGLREAPINGTPEDYIKIYSNAWKDNPKQRPTIENIFDSLENIQSENIYYNSNENNQYIQIEVYANNQFNYFKPMKSYSRDSISIEPNNKISVATSINLENLELTDIGENIHNATLMNGKMKVTLKSIVFNSMELFVSELKKHLNVNSHENIIEFYGISQKDLNSSNFILVLEYSNGETLRNYLKSNFKKLEWRNKLTLAQQIAKAIEHFHSFDIIHGDMNSENILIHNNVIKINNFGISKLVIEPSIDLLNSSGLIEYSDPMLLKAEGKFSRTKASDIYSVGILLWEISSGKIPYESYEFEKLDLISYIIQGKR